LAANKINLYHSLFDDATRHLAVVRALAGNNAGLTRGDVIDKAGLSSGGTITGLFEELIESGFVMAWHYKSFYYFFIGLRYYFFNSDSFFISNYSSLVRTDL
jgi:hypothetical protein